MGGYRFACCLVLVLAPSAAGVPVINEFVSRPAAGEGEWIEILNPGPETVDLQSWAIRDGTGKIRRIQGSALLSPGEFLVLASRPDSLRVFYALADTIRVLRPEGWPVLNDRDAGRGEPADVIVLMDAALAPVDSIAYFEAWLPPESGRSLERVDVRSPGYAAGTWGWSVDEQRATPARINSLAAVSKDMDQGSWTGPETISPGKHPALFHYRMPRPGTMAVSLVDEAGRILKVMQPPRPTGSVGQWIWGPGSYVPARSGDFFICLLWKGEEGSPIRRCQRVWVSR